MTPQAATSELPLGEALPDWLPASLPARSILTGRFCRLEPLLPAAHAQELYDAFLPNPSGWTYLPYGPFPDFPSFQAWLTTAAAGIDPLFYAILNPQTGKAIGVASYLRIDPANGSIEVGHLHFSPLLQSTPAATEAMYLMMQQAFECGFRRYEWKCNALNAPSRRAAQRLGFSYEGLFRQASVVKGHNRDTSWYAIVDKEWPALRTAFAQWLAPTNFDDQGHQRVSLSSLTAPLLYQRG